jgi:hypothetical protein
MTIKLGEMNVKNLFYGTTPITKVYLGAELLTIEDRFSQIPLTWINGVDVSYEPDGTVTKIAGGDAWNAGASSLEETNGLVDFIVEFIPTSTETRIAFGLDELMDGPESYSNKDIDYFWEINPAGLTEITINELKVFTGTYQANDVFKVALEDKIIRFYQNGNVVWETAEITVFPLLAKCAIHGEGKSFKANLYVGNLTKPEVKLTSLTNSVRLDWPVTENTTSWNIYRSEVAGTLGEKVLGGSFIKENTFTDTTVVGGTTYYYTVESKNATSNTALKSEQMAGFPVSELVYENKLVDFIGYTGWTVYGAPEVTNDFGNASTVQGGDRLKIDTAERLRFYLPVGQVGSANAGGIIKSRIAGKDEYTLEYEIRFDTGFPWSKGGKVPGLSGGAGYTGGVPATAGDGFSVRMMWREDGRIIPYVYHFKQEDQFGDTFGATLGYFTNTKAHLVKYYVKLNTSGGGAEGISDGILRIYIDNILVFEKTDMCYRTDQSQIDTCHIAVFPGGSTADWNMTADGYIRLSYVSWQ